MHGDIRIPLPIFLEAAEQIRQGSQVVEMAVGQKYEPGPKPQTFQTCYDRIRIGSRVDDSAASLSFFKVPAVLFALYAGFAYWYDPAIGGDSADDDVVDHGGIVP
jgi:hypothetical protein